MFFKSDFRTPFRVPNLEAPCLEALGRTNSNRGARAESSHSVGLIHRLAVSVIKIITDYGNIAGL